MSPSAFISGNIQLDYKDNDNNDNNLNKKDDEYISFSDELRLLTENNDCFKWIISPQDFTQLLLDYQGTWNCLECFEENSPVNTQLLNLAQKYNIVLNGQLVANHYCDNSVCVLNIQNNITKYHNVSFN